MEKVNYVFRGSTIIINVKLIGIPSTFSHCPVELKPEGSIN